MTELCNFDAPTWVDLAIIDLCGPNEEDDLFFTRFHPGFEPASPRIPKSLLPVEEQQITQPKSPVKRKRADNQDSENAPQIKRQKAEPIAVSVSFSSTLNN